MGRILYVPIRNIYTQNNYFSSYIDIQAISAPSNPSTNIGRIFHSSADGKLYFKKSDGTTVDLESGGGGGGGAPTDSSYLTLGTDATLTAERVLTAGTNIAFVDAGAGSTLTINVPNASESTKGAVELATSVETTAGLAVQASDTRLSDARIPTAHKDTHKSGGTDPFVKGDDLNAASRYLEDIADPLSDAQRIWLEDATANLKYWSDEATPVKHTVSTASNTMTFTNKTFDADGTGNSITNIENADIKALAGIVYSKLSLTDSIVNADINSAAAIATSKLADAANFLLSTLDNDLGAHYFDMTRIAAPADPSANEGRFYVKQVDTNNDGVFCKIKRNGAFVEVQIL